MEGEMKDIGTSDPFKKILRNPLRNIIMIWWKVLREILQRLPTSDPSSSSRGVSPFKVQINIDIPIFEGHIDVDVV
jgi:hypothetical protein